MMKINGKNIEIKEANSFFEKFRGLMFKKNINYGLKLRSNGIHTFFMKDKIDVILTDKNGKVIKIYHGLKPWRIILPKRYVYYTYELPNGFINGFNEEYFEIKKPL